MKGEKMKEYAILIRQGSGKPYYTLPYKSLSEAQNHLNSIIELEEERQRPYYIDNDFHENKYSNISNLKYVCLKVREVSEWSTYSQEKAIENGINKILYLHDYKTS